MAFLLLLLVFSMILLLTSIPFLAPSRPIGNGIFVVEGWVPDYALEEAKGIFETHPYRMLVVPGIPVEQGFFLSKEKNYAQLATDTLKELGLKPELMVPLPCANVPRSRTYATALRVRGWLEAHPGNQNVDVFTLGVHARRTWMLYKMALGDRYRVGIIAGSDRRYVPARWWTTSSGVRTVTSEWIAYLYAKLLFFPGGQEAAESQLDAK